MNKDFGGEEVERVIKCKDCGQNFNFTKGERDFLQKKIDEHEFQDAEGYVRTEVQLPVRCRECRNKRKAFFNQNK